MRRMVLGALVVCASCGDDGSLNRGAPEGDRDGGWTFDAGRDAATTDGRTDAGFAASFDAGFDSSFDAGFDSSFDAGFDSTVDADSDVVIDARFGVSIDAALDASVDAGFDDPADPGFDDPADSGFDDPIDAGFDASTVRGFDAGWFPDAGLDAGSVADGGTDPPPPDAAIPPRVIGPTETVTSLPWMYFSPSTSAGSCSPTCVDWDATDVGAYVHPFTTSVPMQFTSWFTHRSSSDDARETLRDGATCLSSTRYPSIVARVLPAGTYEAVVCNAFSHSMVVEPVPPPAPNTSCATARPLRLFEVVYQVRDASTDRFYFRVSIAPCLPEEVPLMWDGIELSTPMTSASATITIQSGCGAGGTTLQKRELPILDDTYPAWRIHPLPAGEYYLILEVPRGLEYRMRPVER